MECVLKMFRDCEMDGQVGWIITCFVKDRQVARWQVFVVQVTRFTLEY